MPITDPGFTWQEALWAFGVIAVVAFLVTRVLTDLLRIPRTPYIAMLFVAALGLGPGTAPGTAIRHLGGRVVHLGGRVGPHSWSRCRHDRGPARPASARRIPTRPGPTSSDSCCGKRPKMVNAGEPHPVSVSSFDKDGSSGPHGAGTDGGSGSVPSASRRQRPARRVSLAPSMSRCKMEPCGGRTTPSHRDVYQGLARVQRPIVAVGGDA